MARVYQGFLQQESWKLIKHNGLIAVEDLKEKNMVRSRLAKDIAGAEWATFKTQLEYKADRYRRTIKVNHKYTS